ncbi:MAG: type II toxin-antitoxin system RelE/ParE family toxin [Tyzzerella sp.]|nr:type II toxin-antitoxin system RelE/ParE family toxin [Tyzzerella sp.]
MITLRKKVNNIFKVEMYKKESGRVPVMEFLMSLSPKLRAKAVRDIDLLQKHGSDLREPYVKAIKGSENKGLYELRVKFSNDIARIFYFTYCDNKYILLHGFIKKSMKTPPRELERARKYMEDYKRRVGYE